MASLYTREIMVVELSVLEDTALAAVLSGLMYPPCGSPMALAALRGEAVRMAQRVSHAPWQEARHGTGIWSAGSVR